MIDYLEARRAVLSRAKPLPSETVPLEAALGRTAARDVAARRPVPPFAKATMDGYAVRAADTRRAGPARAVALEVVADLPAGRVSRAAVGPGQAVRIMTGAPLPARADAVVMVEDTDTSGSRVRIRRAVRPGENVGAAGEDLARGERILERGALLGPAAIGILASLGLAAVRVARRPRLSLIATGDEIVEPGDEPGPGRIWNSNGHALAALARQAGAEASYLGIARDRAASLRRRLSAARDAEILVLSGGVSVGDYDLVKEGLRRFGVRTVFSEVRIKPGKPVFFGVRGRQLVFGLPGNPTSALVTFHLFVRPAIEAMLGRAYGGHPLARPLTADSVRGRTGPDPRAGRAVLGSALMLKPGRLHFLRGVLAVSGPTLRVDPFPQQQSGVLKSMLKSQVLIVVPADVARVPAGKVVDILRLD